ncbi:MAG TPA: ABC transporter ATP-binding protein [bacterium]|nr:ABC transporter ATP-binding protein [bacterium]
MASHFWFWVVVKGNRTMPDKAGQKPRAITLLDMKLVLRFWRQDWKQFMGLVALTVFYCAIAIAYPRIIGYIVDAIQHGLTDPAHFVLSTLRNLVLLLVGARVIGALAEDFRPLAYMISGARFLWRTRNLVFRSVLDQGFSFTNRFPSGDVQERLDQDLNDVAQFSAMGIFWPMTSVLTMAFTLVILIRMNWLLTVVTLVPTVASFFVYLRIGPSVDKWWKEWREKMSETNSFLESSFSGIRLVKAYTMEERNAGRLRKILNERIRSAVRGAKLRAAFNSTYGIVAGLGSLAVLVLGGAFVIRGKLTIGEFVAFNAYVDMLVWPMIGIADMITWIWQTGVEERRVRELYEFTPDVKVDTGTKPAPDFAEVRLTKVGFSYASVRNQGVKDSRIQGPEAVHSNPGILDSSNPALQDIDIVLTPGARIGIAGTVGSGKSTIMRLLVRAAEPTSGAITVDGTPQPEFEVKSLRSLFGYAPQEAGLFSDTIRDNIILGRTAPDTEERLREVVRIAQLEPELKAMAKGPEELIGERGLRLSGGQQGRVSIARALFDRPRILLLDDVTASLDAETEQQFIRDVMGYMQGATLVIVSHRLSILAACDIVYVLDQGRIVESGQHTDLLARQGLYWKLYQRQIMQEALEKG